jgi:hypothetical protein
VREALALWHDLDPDALFRGDDPVDYLEEVVCPRFADVPGQPLHEFLRQVQKLGKSWIRPHVDAYHGGRHGDSMITKAQAHGLFARKQFPDIAFFPKPEQSSVRPVRHWTKKMDLLFVAQQLYAQEEEGGSFVPSDRSTLPDIDGFLRARDPAISDNLCKAICLILYPDGMGAGRIPKRRTPAWNR